MVSAWLSRQHTARESAPDASAPTRSNVVRRAYDYLRDCGGDVPSIRAVCAVAGVSYATLERGFRETYG